MRDETITAICDGCGWQGKEEELLPDTVGGYVKGDCNEFVFCPNCGVEGWIRRASNNWEETEM